MKDFKKADELARNEYLKLMKSFSKFKKSNHAMDDISVVQAWTAKKIAELFVTVLLWAEELDEVLKGMKQ